MVDLDDAAIDRLCDANYREFSRELARWSGAGGAVVEADGVLLFATASAFPVLVNGVVRLDPRVSADAVLDRAEAWFAERGTGYSLSVHGGRDDDLAERAIQRELLPVADSPQMVCRSPIEGPPPAEGVELRWLAEPDDVDDFVGVQDAAYQSLGMPPGVVAEVVAERNRFLEPHLATVIATLDGRAVAGAQLLLSHGVGGVYFVGVVDDARGRGLAELVTRAVTNAGFARGAAFVGLQASSMGESLYRRMGYEDRYRYRSLARFAGG